VKKIVLAYSGGLDTSVILKWLKEYYQAEVIAALIDVGQKENLKKLSAKARRIGAQKVYVIDARQEFVRDYIFPALQAAVLYEGRYYLATSLARPLIAKKIVEIARREKADSVAHGATGKGNDQVRFETSFRALAPDLKIIAPWRIWNMKSRQDLINYARQHRIPVPVTKEKPYSSDANIWHISYEGGILEDLKNAPDDKMFQMTTPPEKAPDRPENVSLEFVQGVPVKLNNRALSAVKLVDELNRIAGRNGVGIVDIVENRLVGIKSRGVYESPAAVVLYSAHRELESITLDRETFHYKEMVALRYAELIYYGLWFTPLRQALAEFVASTQKVVSGKVVLQLYKGNVKILSRSSPKSLYWEKLATFEREEIYNQQDAGGFINLFSLPYYVAAIRRDYGKR